MPLDTLNWWDDKVVCLSYFINKPLQHVIDHENNIKYRQKRKIKKKSARRKFRSNLNRKLYSENFIYDPLNVFPKPTEPKKKKKVSQNLKISYNI